MKCSPPGSEESRGYCTSYAGAFLYLPSDTVYRPDEEGWPEATSRKRKVRFTFCEDEVFPVHAMSWRILRHILLDRGQREAYASSFPLIQLYYRHMKATADKEAPFVSLVLHQATPVNQALGEDTQRNRARVERLVRWWKLKVKDQREVGTDDSKALRMILAAYLRGDDQPDDPETAFLTNTPS